VRCSFSVLPALCFWIMMATWVPAAVVYDEASMGDLSNDSAFPTDVGFFVPGAGGTLQSNSVIGRTDSGSSDVFTFEIAGGNQLDSLVLANYELGDDAMFVAIARGEEFPDEYFEINDPGFDPGFGPTSPWLGGRVIAGSQVGDDILGLIGDSDVTRIGSGFTSPLGPGRYSFYIQQTGPQNLYTLDFNVSASAVPEPSSSLAVCLIAGAGFGYRQLKRRRFGKRQV
jgi:hypothetical protein